MFLNCYRQFIATILLLSEVHLRLSAFTRITSTDEALYNPQRSLIFLNTVFINVCLMILLKIVVKSTKQVQKHEQLLLSPVSPHLDIVLI